MNVFPSPLYSGERGRGEGVGVDCKTAEFSHGMPSPLTPALSPRVQGERGKRQRLARLIQSLARLIESLARFIMRLAQLIVRELLRILALRCQEFEPFEAERQVGAAFVAREGVDFIDDDPAEAAEQFLGFGVGEEDGQAFRRGQQDMWRSGEVAIACA